MSIDDPANVRKNFEKVWIAFRDAAAEIEEFGQEAGASQLDANFFDLYMTNFIKELTEYRNAFELWVRKCGPTSSERKAALKRIEKLKGKKK